MKKVIICALFLVLAVVTTQIHSVQAYTWLGHEKLNPQTTRFYRHAETKDWGEQHQLLKVSVETQKFFFRTIDGCDLFKVEVYQLLPTQTFEEVSGTFSNGACEKITTLDCDQKCIALSKGNYIFKIIVQGKERGQVFSMVFGPPVRS